jgi:hypothetical protein
MQHCSAAAVIALVGCASHPPPDPECPPSQVICESTDEGDGGKADESTVRVDWGTSIVIVGQRDSVELVKTDLATLTGDPIGAGIIATLEAAAAAAPADADDRRVVLRARDELDPRPFDCARTMFREGWLARSLPIAWTIGDGGRVEVTTPGERVPPGAIRVLYNRNCHQAYEDGTACFQPWFLLAHELLHASHGMSGTILADHPDNSDPMPGGSNHEEAATIGRGAYHGDSPSENAIRAAAGVPVRDSHGMLCGPRGGDTP